MRKDPGGGDSWQKEKDCSLENAFWTTYPPESSKAPLSSVLSPLITFDQPPPPIGARPMPPSRAPPKEGFAEKTVYDNTNTRSDSASGSSSGALGSTPSAATDSTRANERPAALPGYQSAFVSTFAAPNDRPAGQSEYRSAFLSTLAHRNEKQAVAPQVQNSFVHSPARMPRSENYPLGSAFATLSRPPSPPPARALPGIPSVPFASKTPALPTAATRLGASKKNRQASYAAVLGPFVGAPNATARIERVLNEAVGPGGSWRARAPAPGLGLWRRQDQAPGSVLRAVFPLDHAEGEEEEEDGRAESEEDGAGDGADDNTAPAPAPARDRSRPWVRRRHPARGDAEGADNGTDPASAPGPGPQPQPAPAPAPPTGTSDSAPPPYEQPDVLLEEFCRYYGVNATDQARLARLEFEPGDEIDSLSEDDWKGAGFTTLAWRRIVTKNNAFIDDSRSGLWG